MITCSLAQRLKPGRQLGVISLKSHEVGTDAKATKAGEYKEKGLSFFHATSRSVRRGAGRR